MDHEHWTRENALTISLALWLAPQLAVLVIAAVHVPLWLNVPVRMDDLALPELLCVQVIFGAMFFPMLGRGWESGGAVIVLSWPMIAAGAFVSATPVERWVGAGAYVSVLLAGLFAWGFVLRSSRARLIGALAATAWALGGVLLAYVRAEFAGRLAPAIQMQQSASWSAVLGVLAQLQADAARSAWGGPAGVLVSGVLVGLIWRWRGRYDALQRIGD